MGGCMPAYPTRAMKNARFKNDGDSDTAERAPPRSQWTTYPASGMRQA